MALRIKNDGKALEFNTARNLLPEGDYLAVIKAVTPELGIKTKYGKQDRVKLTYEIKDESETPVFSKVDIIWYNEDANSRWNTFLYALYGEELPEELEIQDWVGCDCWIRIEHQKSSDGKTYANITEWSFDFESEMDEDEIRFDDEDND